MLLEYKAHFLYFTLQFSLQDLITDHYFPAKQYKNNVVLGLFLVSGETHIAQTK